MKSAVLTFVYPKVIPFMEGFISSVNKQTDRDFTLYVVNDGILKIKDYFTDVKVPLKIKDAAGTPAKLRIKGIEWVIEQEIDNIIFADSDDLLALNRVEVSKELLNKDSLIFNELLLFRGDDLPFASFYKKRFNEGYCVKEKEIRDGNCLGMSNTAIQRKVIGDFYKDIPETIVAFDWAFYTRVLAGGVAARFTGATATYYRQHGDNIALGANLSDEKIVFGVKVKLQHYLSLDRINRWYQVQADVFGELFKKLQTDEAFKEKYCRAVRLRADDMPLWWEQIKKPEDLEL